MEAQKIAEIAKMNLQEFILYVDSLSTEEFCNWQGIKHPYFTGDVKSSADLFLQIDTIKWRICKEKAKEQSKLSKSKETTKEEVALKVNKFIHEQCIDGVPHDIGWNVVKLIESYTLEQESKWVDLDVQPPIENQKVWIYTNKGNQLEAKYYNKGFEFNNQNDEYCDYWQPLPSPPLPYQKSEVKPLSEIEVDKFAQQKCEALSDAPEIMACVKLLCALFLDAKLKHFLLYAYEIEGETYQLIFRKPNFADDITHTSASIEAKDQEKNWNSVLNYVKGSANDKEFLSAVKDDFTIIRKGLCEKI